MQYFDTSFLVPLILPEATSEQVSGSLEARQGASADAAPIRWLLFILFPASALGDCRTVVGYYARRWRIEDWHPILKSGCKIEELENRSADRLARAVAINLVTAWRIHLTTLIGRDHPELSSDIL